MLKNITTITIANKITILVGLLLLVVGVAGYFLMVSHEHNIIKNQALSVSEIVSRQAGAARSAYVNEVVSKVHKDGVAFAHADYKSLKGGIPIPSQFLKEMAQAASKTSNGLYKYRAVSKWNIGEKQGLNNEFLTSAWEALEKQDNGIPNQVTDWEPVYKIQKFGGEHTFLFLKAMTASHEVCVACHNTYEQEPNIMARRQEQNIETGRRWDKHDLLGAIFVEIPVESMMLVAAKQSKIVIVCIIGLLLLGLLALALFFSRDLVKARKILDRLFWQAKNDTLTRLPNRNSFEHEAELMIAGAKESTSTHVLCFMDLDHFKLVNDTCGHAVGDELLHDISETFLERLNDNCFLARLGGDEFGLIMKHCEMNEAEALAQELCEAVRDFQFIRGEHSFDIGVSIGLVEINEHSETVDKSMRCADLACYAAKDAGKNRTHVYQNDDVDLNRKAAETSWASEMIRALDENRIVIYSQRIGRVSSLKGNHVHHEILVRLIDREGNVVLPDSFIPAAERYKMMPKLDLAIIDRSLDALSKGYFKDLGSNGFISINLSGQSFSEKDFLLKVKSLMMQYRVDPKQVCFEITESAAIANQVLVKEFMVAMKRLGVKFALDDFGTGLSSLTYLKQFPVDYLKIDGSFIKDILTDEIDRTLVDAINQMAHTMGLKTIAEYVESKDILHLLGTLDVDYAQGYFIQKPTPVDLTPKPL